MSRSVLFIDAQVPNYQQLIAETFSGIEIFVLDPGQDGVRQITEVLGSSFNFSKAHIVSHGSPGCLYLGNTQLSLDTLDDYAEELQSWFSITLILYGCNVAAGDAGAEFLEKLQRLTGAGIAASTTPIGHADKGGNWTLDAGTLNANAELAFNPTAQMEWVHVLDPFENQPYFYHVDDNRLEVYNPLTESYERIGEPQGDYDATGFNPADNFIYGSQNDNLLRINDDGEAENLTEAPFNFPPIQDRDRLDAAAIDDDNNYWSIIRSRSLISVNLTDGSQIRIDDFQPDGDAVFGGDLAFVDDIVYIPSATGEDLFYGAQDGRVYTIDPATATFTNRTVANLPNGIYSSAWVDSDQDLYVFRTFDGQFYRIDDYDTDNPTATLVGTGPNQGNEDGMSDPGQLSPFKVPFIDPNPNQAFDGTSPFPFEHKTFFTGGGAAVPIVSASVDLSDFDGNTSPTPEEATIAEATVTLTDAAADDELSITGTLPTSIDPAVIDTSVPGEITLTLTSNLAEGSTPEDFETALTQVRFNNTSDDAGDARQIRIQLTDTEGNLGNSAVTSITVTEPATGSFGDCKLVCVSDQHSQ